MILAEKIIKLRKQNGWSQEELAMRMDVSRQSVSKWESMSSIPDLDKIVKLSKLFGVSTDYLLRDDMEETENIDVPADFTESETTKRNVTLDEANRFMEFNDAAAPRIAFGVLMCIISPVLLIVMSGLSESGILGISENLAAGIGVAVLLIIVALAVMLFVSTGMKLSKYEYLEKEILDLEYGIAGIAETKKENYEDKHKKDMAVGIGLCVASAVPLLLTVAFTEAELIMVLMVGILLIMVAAGVFLIVRTSMINSAYQKLLEEGDYTPERKMTAKKNDNLSTIYWCTVVAIYLGWSFLSGDWNFTWIIWPVAGVFFGAVCAIANVLRKK